MVISHKVTALIPVNRKTFCLSKLANYTIVMWKDGMDEHYGIVVPTPNIKQKVVAYFDGGWEYNESVEFEVVPNGTVITVEVNKRDQ